MRLIQSVLLVAAHTALLVKAAAAQSLLTDPTSNVPIANEVNIGGGGWAQIYNQAELAAFAIDVVVALALATLIALHPVRRAARSKPLDFILPRLFAFYALIGMVVGFLVDQHGYIIGFVIFGIGALLRFRSNLDDPVDTVEMILVTVLGLCVGLNLPIMAILIGAVSWVLIWVSGRHLPIELRLQADSAEQLEHALDRVHQIARQEQWKEGFLHRSHSKNTARMILLLHASVGEEGVESALQKGLDGEGLIWKLGS